MDSCLGPRGSCEPGRIVVDIFDGKPWIASRIRNNNLRQHCRFLGRTYRIQTPILERDRPFCRRLLVIIAERSSMLTDLHPRKLALIPAIVRMARYAGRWLRSPETWSPLPGLEAEEQWRSLVDHLFSRGYPLPRFLASAWLTKGTVIHAERTWFCYLAAGVSLTRARNFPRSVTARARHLAMQAPDHFTLRQALRWGQVKACRGSDALVKEVIASRMVHDFSNDGIWTRLIEKFAASPDAVVAGDFGMVVDLFRPELKEGRTGHVEELLVLPLPVLLKHAWSYWNGLLVRYREQRLRFSSSDVRHGGLRHRLNDLVRGNWKVMSGTRRAQSFHHSRCYWRIRQLTSHVQLIRESQVMKNCLANYYSRCMRGESVIFSFRWAEDAFTNKTERCIDVEVDPETRRICQIRNRDNHWLRLDRTPVVKEWARQNQMR